MANTFISRKRGPNKPPRSGRYQGESTPILLAANSIQVHVSFSLSIDRFEQNEPTTQDIRICTEFPYILVWSEVFAKSVLKSDRGARGMRHRRRVARERHATGGGAIFQSYQQQTQPTRRKYHTILSCYHIASDVRGLYQRLIPETAHMRHASWRAVCWSAPHQRPTIPHEPTKKRCLAVCGCVREEEEDEDEGNGDEARVGELWK